MTLFADPSFFVLLAVAVVPAAALGLTGHTLRHYGLAVSDKGDVFDPWTVKGSQLRRPLLEFSAACAGCGANRLLKEGKCDA